MRVIYLPKESDFQIKSGGNFPVFRALPMRGRGFGSVTRFLSNVVLPFVKKRVIPKALNAAKRTAADVLIHKKTPKKAIKRRLMQAGKELVAETLTPNKRYPKKIKRKKISKKTRDIFSNM